MPTSQSKILHGGEYGGKGEIKLDFSVNINPLGIPGEVNYALTTGISSLINYPERTQDSLRKKLSKKLNQDFADNSLSVTPENILFGNGASEIICLIAEAVSPRCAMIVKPTFSGYERALRVRGTEIIDFILVEKGSGDSLCFDLETDALLDDIRKRHPDILFICNPNNPTGKLVSPSSISRIADLCEELEIYFVIDECFIGFSENGNAISAVSLTPSHPHLIVLNAFTKLYAIPGVRLGYCVCSGSPLISKMFLLQPEWSISGIAQLAGLTALDEDKYVRTSVSLVSKERTFLTKELKKFGLKVYKSDTNFILIKSIDTKLSEKLAEKHGILIRRLDEHFYRVAVRKHEDNVLLLEALSDIL